MTLLRRLVNRPRQLVLWYVITYVALSELYALVEGKGPIEGLWWGIVTGSTVGYGDSYPTSTAGRGIGAILIFVSVAFVAMATAQLANHLLTDPNAWTHEEQEEIKQGIKTLLVQQEVMELRVTHLVQALTAAGIVPPRETPSRRDESDNT